MLCWLLLALATVFNQLKGINVKFLRNQTGFLASKGIYSTSSLLKAKCVALSAEPGHIESAGIEAAGSQSTDSDPPKTDQLGLVDYTEEPKGLPAFQYEKSANPRYPYYDAPRNLFFDVAKALSADGKEVQQEDPVRTEFLNNVWRRRNGEFTPPKTDPWTDLTNCLRPNAAHSKDYFLSPSNEALNETVPPSTMLLILESALGPLTRSSRNWASMSILLCSQRRL